MLFCLFFASICIQASPPSMANLPSLAMWPNVSCQESDVPRTLPQVQSVFLEGFAAMLFPRASLKDKPNCPAARRIKGSRPGPFLDANCVDNHMPTFVPTIFHWGRPSFSHVLATG